MIETIVINYLKGAGLSVGQHIYAEKPVDPPAEYVLVEKTGSSRTDKLDRAMVAVQSVCRRKDETDSLLRAMQINEEVKTAMYDIILLDEIFSCSLNSDYNFTNTDTKEHRYQAVFNIFY